MHVDIQTLKPIRYLTTFSYVGTKYCGIQRNVTENSNGKKSISEVIQEGLSQFNKKQNNINTKIRTASRTDIGVHALCNACTFDTSELITRKQYQTPQLMAGLNSYFLINNHQIQVNNLYQTRDPRFDCRGSPIQRTYQYKLLLIHQTKEKISPLKIFYRDQAWVLKKQEFCLTKLEEACKLFEGLHCFRHFVKVNMREPDILGYWRKIDAINFEIKKPELCTQDEQLIVVEINSKSFLWHQIRIIMENIVNYAYGKIEKQQMIDLLSGEENILLKYPLYQKAQAPAAGLYLANIQYNFDDIIIQE